MWHEVQRRCRGGVEAARLSFLRKKTEKVEAEFFFVAAQEIFSFHPRMESISALEFFCLRAVIFLGIESE